MKRASTKLVDGKAWAIVTKGGGFADGRAGYALFSSKREAGKWMLEGERIARVRITETTPTRRQP